MNGGQVKATTKVELTRPHTLYAHWRGHVYTLAFDLNGAAGALPPLTMEYGEAKTLPSCPVRRRDFDFAGWALSPDGAVDFADGAEVRDLTDADGATVTLYAVWAPRTWTLSDYLNAGGLAFATDGDAAWFPDEGTGLDGDGSLRSGVIGQEQRSTLKTSVTGKGVLSFWWKVDCEPGDSETGDIYDYLELTVDGARPATVQPIAGDVGWTRVTVRIDGGDAVAHEVCWSFVKDDWDEAEFADVAWVDEVTWTVCASARTSSAPCAHRPRRSRPRRASSPSPSRSSRPVRQLRPARSWPACRDREARRPSTRTPACPRS